SPNSERELKISRNVQNSDCLENWTIVVAGDLRITSDAGHEKISLNYQEMAKKRHDTQKRWT
ncbi:unnamed protein product, partial [Larinioides sclopetarius]